MKKILSHKAAVIVFILFIGIFFYKQLFLGYVFYCCDNFNFNVPTKVFLASSILNDHQFPLWNPYILSGSPFFSDLGFTTLNITNVLYFFLSPFQALTWSIILSVALAYWGTYWCVRQLKISKIGSILAATIYAFSGVMGDSHNNVAVLFSASFLPLVFGSWIWFFNGISWKKLPLVVLICTAQLISGHPQVTFYTFLWSLAYVLVFVKIDFKEKLKWSLAILSLSALCSAFQTVPFFLYALDATRNVLGTDYSSFASLKPILTIRFILPFIVGIRSLGTAIIENGSIGGYVGILPLLFLLKFTWKKPILRFFGISMLISLLLSFGGKTPAFWLFSLLIPGFSKFRMPQMMLFIYTMSITVLSAIIIDEIKNNNDKLIQKIFPIIGFTFFLFGSIGSIASELFAKCIIQWWSPYFPLKVIQKLAFPDTMMTSTIIRQTSWNILGIGILCIFVSFAYRKWKQKNVWKYVTVFLVFLDVFIVSSVGMRSITEEKIRDWFSEGKKTVSSMEGLDLKNDRMYVIPMAHGSPRIKLYGIDNESEEEEWQAKILRPDVNMYFNVSSVEGYASIIPISYQRYFNDQKFEPTGISVLEPYDSHVASVSGKFLIDKKGRNVEVKNNENAKKKLFLRFDDGSINTEAVTVISYTPNEVVVYTSSDKPSSVVFLDQNYPGWHVSVDGSVGRIKEYDSIFKSVELSSGDHTVRFWYFSNSLSVGILLSLVGIVYIVMISIKAIGEGYR